MITKALASAGIVTAVLALGAPAFAGEITGNGEPTPVNEYRAGSICAFSGLDDNDFEAPVEPGKTQTFGGELRAFAEVYPGGVSGLAQDGLIRTGPGTECRGFASGG